MSNNFPIFKLSNYIALFNFLVKLYNELTQGDNTTNGMFYYALQMINTQMNYMENHNKYLEVILTKNKFVHMLNGTAIAVSRTLIALIENGKQKDGSIKLPSCLNLPDIHAPEK